MNPNEGEVKDYAKKFRWIDSNTIKVINREGVEKIVDIRNGFKEIAFSKVPLFSEITNYKHFYFKSESPEISDTLKRLKINYQRHKSAYNLEGKRESW